MNCHKAEEQLSRSLDGELPENERLELVAHLASCAPCRELQQQWSTYSSMLREDVPLVQTPEALWADVQRAIRLQDRQGGAEDAGVFGWRVRWAAVMIVAVLLGMSAFGLVRLRRGDAEVASAREAATEVEFVETDVPGASPMVYQDADSGWTVIWVAGMETGEETGKGS